MKKFLKIFGVVLLTIILLMIAAPFVFKGKIVKVANQQMEENLNAHASFSDIKLSLFKNFPNLSITIIDLNIVGKDPFEGDTLISIPTFQLVVDVISAFKMENIEIKKMILDRPLMNAIILADGRANWDIVPESDEEIPVDTSSSDVSTVIALKLFSIQNGIIRYDDRESDMFASLNNMNFSLTGNLAEDVSLLTINSDVEKFSFIMEGLNYLTNTNLKLFMDIDANLKESVYLLKQNEISINALTLILDGSVEMPESGDIITNLKFGTNKSDFKTLLSLIPAFYMTDYSDMKTTGIFQLEGKLFGAMTETTMPSADIKLLVNNGTFSYPDLPKTAKDIAIDVDVHYDGVQEDNTTVDINKFHLDLGGNPIDMVLNLRNLMTDPFTNGKLMMSIDLATIKELMPLENTELTGMIKANLNWMGKVSAIENEKYDEFKASGDISVDNLYYNSPDVPKPFALSKAFISFTPELMTLSAFDSKLGKSDFSLKGSFSNYIPYSLKDQTLKGELSLNSKFIDLDEFMTDTEVEATAEVDSAPLTIVEVPANLNFTMNSKIESLKYDGMDITQLDGTIIIKDQEVKMEKLNMNMLQGTVALSGAYNTQDIKHPIADFNFNANEIDIPMASETFATLGKLAPIVKKATGKVSVGMNYTSQLTGEMEPVMNSIACNGRLTSKQIGIKNSSALTKVGETLKTDAFNNLTLKDVDLKFEVVNGNLFVEPFEVKMGDMSMLIAGEQSLTNTLNYGVNLSAPRMLLGLENPAVNSLYISAASKGVNIPKSDMVNMLIKINGEMTNPKVTIDLKDNVTKTATAVKEELKEAGKKAIETKKEEIKTDAKEKARAEADKIMKEAEKQAQNIRTEAKKTADAVRKEANLNADRVLNEAKNPLAKTAAKPTAEKIRKEGDNKALAIEREANDKANKVLSEGKAKSDQLLK